jgi:hypothetical protein
LNVPDRLAVGDPAGGGVPRVDGQARAALAADEDGLGGEGGVEEMMRGRRDEGQGIAPGQLGALCTLSRGGV